MWEFARVRVTSTKVLRTPQLRLRSQQHRFCARRSLLTPTERAFPYSRNRFWPNLLLHSPRYHRQIEVAASAARSLHFASSTPRMKSQPLVAITPTIANSATPTNAWDPSGGQR